MELPRTSPPQQIETPWTHEQVRPHFDALDYMGGVALGGVLDFSHRLGATVPLSLRTHFTVHGLRSRLPDFFLRAKEGYRMLFRMGAESPHQIKPDKVLKVLGTGSAAAVHNMLSELGIHFQGEREVEMPNKDLAFSVFTHTFWTLRMLQQKRAVSLQDLMILPGLDTYEVVSKRSFWNAPSDPEGVWNSISELGSITERAYNAGVVSEAELLKTAHFLGASLLNIQKMIKHGSKLRIEG